MNAPPLDHDLLREVVARELFDWGPAGSEGYALRLEALASTPSPARECGSPFARPRAVPPAPCASGALYAALQQAAAAIGVPFEPRALWAGSSVAGARIDLGAGDQVRVHSGWCGTPGHAEQVAARVQDALRAALAAHGVLLLQLGSDPWHPSDARAGSDSTPWGQCQELVYRSAGAVGGLALRASAGSVVQLAFGGPQRGPRRWRAAWLLAPLFEALFAHSPLEQGASARVKSARARAWRLGEPTRCGFPRDVLESPSMSAVDQYLEFGLAARALWVVREEQVFALTQPCSFDAWNRSGLEGVRPTLDDWRCHLATLRPLVRPAGSILFECGDAQGRAFGGVPLALASVALCDDSALEAVTARFAGLRSQGLARLDNGLRDGLLDPALGDEARALFAIVAEALARLPAGWLAPEQARALALFAQRFVRRSRTPADDLLDVFIEQGELSLAQLEALEDEWCAAAGVSVTWRDTRRSA